MRYLLALTLPLYALDQATKWWIIRNVEFRSEQVPVIADFFHLCHWDNTGAAFGMFKDNNLAFIILSLCALIGLIVFQFRGAFVDKLSKVAVALLLAGILGNLTDRLLYGHVVDFLLFYLGIPGADPWPAFNVADSCICISAVLLVIASFQQPAPKPRKEKLAEMRD